MPEVDVKNPDRSPFNIVKAKFAPAFVPSVIIISPVLVFVRFHDYGVTRSETLICLGIFLVLGLCLGSFMLPERPLFRAVAITGLITLFLDLQFNLETVLRESLRGEILGWISWRSAGTVLLISVWSVCFLLTWPLRKHLPLVVGSIFSTFLLATLAFPVGKVQYGDRHIGGLPNNHNGTIPPIIHLILDEHIGVSGVPIDIEGGLGLKMKLRSLFQEFRFRVYSDAYSLYLNTDDSISNMLNFSASEIVAKYIVRKGPRRSLDKNEYFALLAHRGYALRVYQSDYLDFCDGDEAKISFCFEYPSTSIKSFENVQMSVREKVRLLMSIFLSRSFIYSSVRVFYLKVVYSPLGERLSLPAWNWERERLGPLPVMPVFEILKEDILSQPRGTVFFAHMLMPHFPYIYDSICSLRDVGEWYSRVDPTMTGLSRNSPRSRTLRYMRYFDQLGCVYKQIHELFEEMNEAGIFEDAIVIVHGDHGSKITIVDPHEISTGQTTHDDYIDSFSTLFAVKAPDIQAGIDRHSQSIHQLFPEFWVDGNVDSSEHFVYLKRRAGTRGRPLIRQKIMLFGEDVRHQRVLDRW